MTELLTKFKKRKHYKDQKTFAVRYRHCNRCEKQLKIYRDEEIVCVLCGETFCESCIRKHQQYCY
ncbi:MAG: hypothetical protein ACW986_17965 [Promethearchaeota archaeon]|jgi:hypothetical protein